MLRVTGLNSHSSDVRDFSGMPVYDVVLVLRLVK